ncbi:MAG: hypothetical protein SV186_03300 [Candidatus Nanohaloarchaea archaeon]|nr:hypothetical protein [Candidatus Nanohaloarchaea archaeon]
MRWTMLLLATMLLFTTAGTAAPLTEDWRPFRTPISSCATDSACTLNDTVDVTVNQAVTVNTGDTGYCGTAGARAMIEVPANVSVLQLTVDASKDSWGPGPAIMLNGREVRRFSAGENPDEETWEGVTVPVNVSGVSGTANLSVIVSDHSQDWCNMGDHTQRIALQQASFGTGGEEMPSNDTEEMFTLGQLPERLGRGDAVAVADAADLNITAKARQIVDELDAELVSPRQTGIYDQYDDVVLVGSPAINPLVRDLAEHGKTWTYAEWMDHPDTALLQTLADPTNILIVAGYDTGSHLRALAYLEEILDGEHQDTVEGEERLVLSRETPDQDLAVKGFTTQQVEGGYNVTYTFTASHQTEATIRYLPSGMEERHSLLEGVNRFTRFVDGTRTVTVRFRSELRVGGVPLSLARQEGGTIALTTSSRRVEMQPGGTAKIGNASLRLLNVSRSSTGGSATFRIDTGMTAIGAVVDPTDRIDETDETNNRRFIVIGNVSQPPNLPREPEPRPVNRTIPLEPGWNMISVKEPTPLQELTDDCRLRSYRGERVWRYSGGWHHARTLQPRLGYYVYSSRTCKAIYTVQRAPYFRPAQDGAVEPMAGQATTSRDIDTGSRPEGPWRLQAGWNMIGVRQETSLAKLQAQCDVRRYQGAALLSYSDGWERYALDAELDPETGYFVNVAEACTLGVFENLPEGDQGDRSENLTNSTLSGGDR